MNVCVQLAEGFEELEAISIIDVLRRAEINVVTVSMDNEIIVKGSHKIEVKADKLFKDIDYDYVDMIILPGGMPGAKNLEEHKGLNEKIKRFAKKGKYLAAICAAPMVYGKMGLLINHNAISYPGFENFLEGAKIVDENVVQSGKIITSKGPGTALNFALKLVEIIKGKNVVKEIKESMLIK
ncbi:MAG: DJ-1 family protein [Fusobacteriia bacterium 4572_132]|nr:MAG: DJ-1 family protein [Fusobacteriia bacterium 4572_132]